KVFNHGPADATGIVVRDILPAGLQPLEAVLSQGSFDLQTGAWTVGALPQGGMAQLDLSVVAAQPGSFQNTLARIASEPTDPNAANDVSSAGFDVSAGTDGARHVAIGDVDGDGQNEIVVGIGAGGRPEGLLFSRTGTDVVLRFLAYHPAFQGGVRVAACDVNGDGIDEVVTAAGPGGGPHVRVLSLSGGS